MTDSDGASNSTFANVTVVKGKIFITMIIAVAQHWKSLLYRDVRQ